MQRITIDYTPPKIEKSTIKSERAFLISQFLERLNTERIGTKYKPLTARGVAIKVAHLSLQDLDYLWKICDRAESFGKVFFGSLKEKI